MYVITRTIGKCKRMNTINKRVEKHFNNTDECVKRNALKALTMIMNDIAEYPYTEFTSFMYNDVLCEMEIKTDDDGMKYYTVTFWLDEEFTSHCKSRYNAHLFKEICIDKTYTTETNNEESDTNNTTESDTNNTTESDNTTETVNSTNNEESDTPDTTTDTNNDTTSYTPKTATNTVFDTDNETIKAKINSVYGISAANNITTDTTINNILEIIIKLEKLFDTVDKYKNSYMWHGDNGNISTREYKEKRDSIDEFEWYDNGDKYTAKFTVTYTRYSVYAKGTYTKNGKQTTITAIKNSYNRLIQAVQRE